ncbi:MAG: hypothetical protein ACFFHV_23165 [Promethearchaeota archaeon]
MFKRIPRTLRAIPPIAKLASQFAPRITPIFCSGITAKNADKIALRMIF